MQNGQDAQAHFKAELFRDWGFAAARARAEALMEALPGSSFGKKTRARASLSRKDQGYSLVMLATFWACLLRKTDVWKAYGAASIVYFLATVDATFIRKYELDVTEVGTEVDLVLSFISVVATEAWTVFF